VFVWLYFFDCKITFLYGLSAQQCCPAHTDTDKLARIHATASFSSGNFVFIVRSLRNMLEFCKDHCNPLLETPWVNADDSSLTRTL